MNKVIPTLTLAMLAVLVNNADSVATVITGLDLFVYQKYATRLNVLARMQETVELIDWKNPIQVSQ